MTLQKDCNDNARRLVKCHVTPAQHTQLRMAAAAKGKTLDAFVAAAACQAAKTALSNYGKKAGRSRGIPGED